MDSISKFGLARVAGIKAAIEELPEAEFVEIRKGVAERDVTFGIRKSSGPGGREAGQI